MIKLRTWHEYPPIPDRNFDWGAMDDNDNDDGRLVGWGPTEQDAIEDLYRLFAERAEAHGDVPDEQA